MRRTSLSLFLSKISASVLTVAVVLPSFAQAASVTQALRVSADQTVARGDFIRAAIEVLDIPKGRAGMELPYRRVPKAMTPVIQAAHQKGALDVFGEDLLLARGITRGQALRVMAALKGFDGQTVTGFRDVRDATPEASAVSVAITHRWMTPLQPDFFGVNRLLLGKDAILLLRKASGQSVETQEVPDRFDNISQQSVKVTIPNLGGRTGGSLPKASILEAIWQLINDQFLYNDKIDAEEAAYRAAEAIVQSLDDPYTTFLRPVGINNLQTQIGGTVSGIGAQVEERNGVLTVVTPLRGSPAEAAGLKPNDEILKANGVDLTDLEFTEAVEHVRGPKGSTVKLHIRRAGIEFDINVERDTVKIPEIEITDRGDVFVVRLMQFGKLTENELRNEMVRIQSENPKGIILDLRNNPGGLLHAAEIVVSNFVPRGTAVAQIIERNSTRDEHTEFDPTIDPKVKLVVLVNEGSASASEIVAGALQDAGRATIVGTKTFGKGTVQQIVRFTDESGLKMSIAEWKTPSGRRIDGVGVQPDIVQEFTSERDEQMLRALELLR